MDNWNAPQWADLNSSEVFDIDDYFNIEHKELEHPRYFNNTSNDSFTNLSNSNTSVSNSSYNSPGVNGLSNSMVMTRTSRGSHSLLNKTSESLASAMNALYIDSAKKSLTKRFVTKKTLKSERLKSVSEKSSSIDGDKSSVTEKKETGSDFYENNPTKITSQQDQQKEGSGSVNNLKEENAEKIETLNEPAEKIIDTVKALKPLKPRLKAEKLDQPKKNWVNDQTKLGSRSDTSKILISDKKNLMGKSNKFRVLTSQVRRRSITKHRRQSCEPVSLPDVVPRLQNATSKQFRSGNTKDNKAGSLEKLKQTKAKLTCPKSPVLRCKTRTRTNVSASNKEQACIKPNSKMTSIPRSLSSAQERLANNGKTLNNMDKKPSTTSPEQKKTKLSPKVLPMLKEIDKIIVELNCSNDPNIMLTPLKSESMGKHTPCKKTVPTIVSTEDGMKIKDVEILHFGIPVVNDYKKITRTKPFSFDTRNKELENKRQILKNLQAKEKPKKSLFHAKSAPSFNPVKKTSVLRSKENNPNKGNPSNVRTMSFQERNELAIKKRKELMDRIVEKEKRARIFHAKPAPNFKPLAGVRGNSTVNPRAADKNKETRGISTAMRQQRHNQKSVASDNEKNTDPIVANQRCEKPA